MKGVGGDHQIHATDGRIGMLQRSETSLAAPTPNPVATIPSATGQRPAPKNYPCFGLQVNEHGRYALYILMHGQRLGHQCKPPPLLAGNRHARALEGSGFRSTPFKVFGKKPS